ncbi:MAG: hypothetical protein ACM339_10040 [Ignavibacteria bacterium]
MNFNDIIHAVLFNKSKILKVTVIATLLLFLILFFIYPITYQSPISILPPEKDNQTIGLGTLLSGQDFSSLLTGGSSNVSSQLFAQILESRTAALYVVKKYDLVDYYNSDNVYEAAKKLTEDLNIDITKEGILKLYVEVRTSFFPMIFENIDSVKKFSAALSNSYVEALDIINREKLSSRAKKARQYIEDQLITTKLRLDSVELGLMQFQEKNKTISLPEQVSAAIDAAAKLKAEIVKTEVEIGFLQPNLREDNQTLLSLKSKLQELKDQYEKMELGNQDYLLAFKEVPELGRELASLLREVKIQNEVYLLLQQQYYKEKIQENKDLPTVEILDEAIPPLKASGPRVFFATVTGGIFIFLFMSLIYVIQDRKIYLVRKENSNHLKTEAERKNLIV